ncbi:mechanosensitive ion channel protein 6-like [Bidens hawaiensis]|uniref:mechanosensitive ion channel protein 6-like n=1 Tax=Bidens hawaiensis TaxID=980011 RepID=UPI004049E2EA
MANLGRSFPGHSPNDPFIEIHEEKHFPGDTSGQLTPKEVRVSFNNVPRPQSAGQWSTPSRRSSTVIGRSGEQVLCSSNGAFKRNSTLMRTKTKSRLLDEPEIEYQRSAQKTPRSGHQGKGTFSDFEEDEFSLFDDMPEEYKELRYNKWTLLQLTSLILIIAVLVCTLAIPDFKNKDVYGLEWWKWEIMIFVVICGRLVSGWGIQIIVFFIERSFMLRKRVLYFVYGLKKAVQNCIWFGLILIAWQCIFDKKVERVAYGKKVLPYVTRVWVCLLVGTIIWLLKTLLIKVLASNFHVSKYFDWIQDSLFNQYVIETLSGPPVNKIQQEQEDEEWMMEEIEKLQNAGASMPLQLKANMLTGSFKGFGTPVSSTGRTHKSDGGSPKKHENTGITIDHLHRMNKKNISAWNMSRMMNSISRSMLSTLDEQLEDFAGDGDEDEASTQITSAKQAKIAAKKIFCNVAKPGSKHIYIEDLMRFLGNDEALKTFRLFDGASETRGISKRALKNWVVNAFQERRALALSLKDTKTAVDNLHKMLTVFVGIIIIVIWLIILKVATTHFFILMCSQLVMVAFVFGNASKTTFEAIIFLFIVHPFDVGDRCDINGVQMIVEEMNILTTIFLRYDNQKIAYPNNVLSAMPIANYHRSPDMGDAIDFCIHVSTPAEKIAKMKERITSYVENNSEHWQPGPMIVVRDVEDLNRLKISIWLSHRMNFQNMGERWKRRALLVEELIKIFKDLDIEYRMLPMDINVRDLPALGSNRLPSNWTACAN